MKSKLITLCGHYASPACKYSTCETLVEWDLLRKFNSQAKLLSESNNCELLEKQFDSENAMRDFSNRKISFYNHDYLFYKSIVKDEKPMAIGKEFYIIVMLTNKNAPVIAVNVIGEKEKTMDNILDQLSGEFSSDVKYSRFEKHKSIKYDFNKNDTKKMLTDARESLDNLAISFHAGH